MSFALTDDHRELAAGVDHLLVRRDAVGGNRALLEAAAEELPAWWPEAVEAGWLGLHLPEDAGGAGFGVAELAVVVEGCGRHLAAGPLVPTTVVSAVLAEVGGADDVVRALTEGSLVGGFGHGDLGIGDGSASGSAVVLGGGLADVLLLASGDDLVLARRGEGVTISVPHNIDPSRRTAKVVLDRAPVAHLPGAAGTLRDLSRLLLAAEAVGVARRSTEAAAAYAKIREQFGRPIATFQAVKHHAADMAAATELATAAVWDAARVSVDEPEQRTLTAAVAATMAAQAVDLCTNLGTQLHGGIAITWEHDAHLATRRGVALQVFLDAERAASELAAMTVAGVARAGGVELPPEAESFREQVRPVVDRLRGLTAEEQLPVLLETGYAVPHWPAPFGRAASAVEQLVIEEEFRAAGIRKPGYGITAWVLLTLVQQATPEQVERWVPPALRREVIWCQLFSEPAAGSDAAGIRTRAVRTAGGWIVNGQKVWTTGAHQAGFGLLTVRTDPDVPKHQGITTVVVDMHAPGVTVRPLRQTSGDSEFNEVFFDDVFVPDEDVVGEVDRGWTVARATLGNESVSIGGDDSISVPGSMVVDAVAADPARVPGGMARAGRYVALGQAIRDLNLRSAQRAVSGGEPGPEGAITKLMLSELAHEATAVLTAAAGDEALFLDGPGMIAGRMQLMHRAISIAGGTSEIKRNQIAERILGMPRDPLIT